jgi:hypothetical protein
MALVAAIFQHFLPSSPFLIGLAELIPGHGVGCFVPWLRTLLLAWRGSVSASMLCCGFVMYASSSSSSSSHDLDISRLDRTWMYLSYIYGTQRLSGCFASCYSVAILRGCTVPGHCCLICSKLILEDHKVSIGRVVENVRPVYAFVCGTVLTIYEDDLDIVASHFGVLYSCSLPS